MNNDFKGWHVLCVKSLHERKVYSQLLESSIEAFLPLIETVRKWSDRKKIILKPLFPSYIFVNINSSSDFHKTLSLYGAYSYIRFGKEYARITKKEIDQVKLLIGDKNIIDIETNVRLPRVGDTKKITYGPLNGLDCEIIKVNNHNKIIVRLDSLRLNIVATIPLYSIENIL